MMFKQWRTLAVMLLMIVTATRALAQDSEATKTVSDDVLAKVTFLPVDSIVDGDLTVTNFANDGTATLPLVTSVPVACSIVYGTTPEFGQLTLDQNMNGGTHSNHNPVLSNLEPETTYYYRVQGADDYGNIYLSDVMTFTTPAQVETKNNNLLSPENGATILDYSSAFGGANADETWGINSAFDGSQNSAWSTAGDGNDAYVEVQLAGKASIRQVGFWTRSMSNDTARVFEFTVTTDSGDVYGPFTLPDASEMYTFDVAFEAETLRFDVTDSNGGNTGAVEIVAYGTLLDG